MAPFELFDSGDLTDDAFLGGALRILQPRKGYRAGIDAVLLAAAVDAKGKSCLDVGAGVGTAGLCVARREPSCSVTLLERDAAVAQLAAENIARNGLADRVRRVEGRLTASDQELTALGMTPGGYDRVFTNPPFHEADGGTRSRVALKDQAHVMAENFDVWARFLARMAAPDGAVTVIHKADALKQILDGMDGRFGALRILPIHPRASEAAIRVIMRGVKGSRAPLSIRPGFVLHGEGNGFTEAAQAILRRGEPLPFGS